MRFGDEAGLFWTTPDKKCSSYVAPRGPLPESDWVPPTEFPSLVGAKRIAIDLETCDPTLKSMGPGVRRGGFVVGIAVGREDGCRWYFPFAHEGGDNLEKTAVLGWAREELNKFDGEVVGANLLYDLDYCAENGITMPHVRRFLDVQVAEPLLDENRRWYNLDALSEDYLQEGKDETLLRQASASLGITGKDAIKANLWRLPARFVGPYAEGDVDRPLRILPHQEKALAAEDLTDLFDLESRLIPVLLAMRRRGVRIDRARVDEVRARLVLERDKYLSIVRQHCGPSAALMAPASLVKALEARGLKVNRTPKSKEPQINKEFLERNAGDELVDAIFNERQAQTIIGTFLDGGILGHEINGRIHCQFNQLKNDEGGTIGRFSSSNPNLQNIPARDPVIGPLVRGLFIPEEGEDWEKCDESQIEYRLLTHYAVGKGSEEAREAYRTNPKTDYHKFVANMLGVDPEDKIKRKRVKNTNFAKGYGAQAPRLAATFGCSIAEAQAFVQEYDEKLPFSKATFELAERRAKQRGFIHTLLKRRVRYQLWEPAGITGSDRPRPLPEEEARERWGRIQRANAYKALNNLLQLGSADILKKAMVDIWEGGVCDDLGAPLLTVHDELDWSVPRTVAGDRAAKEAQHLMEVAIPLKVPVIAESERARNWGECK